MVYGIIYLFILLTGFIVYRKHRKNRAIQIGFMIIFIVPFLFFLMMSLFRWGSKDLGLLMIAVGFCLPILLIGIGFVLGGYFKVRIKQRSER